MLQRPKGYDPRGELFFFERGVASQRARAHPRGPRPPGGVLQQVSSKTQPIPPELPGENKKALVVLEFQPTDKLPQ